MKGNGSAPGTVFVRPIQPDDVQAVTAFMVGVYPSLCASPEFAERYYRWKYFDLHGRETGFPAALITEDEEGIVGFMGCMPFWLRYEDQRTPGAWIADWHLRARGRGRGIGRRLLQAAVETIPSLACVNGSEDAQRVFRDFGFRAWDCAETWLRVCHPIAYEGPRSRGLKKPLLLFHSAVHLIDSLTANLAKTESLDIHLESDDNQGPAESLLDPRGYNGMVRDKGYLRWLTRCPVGLTRFHAISVSGRAAGYVLVQIGQDRANRRRGRILDLYMVPADSELVAGAYVLTCQILAEVWKVDYIDWKAPVSLRTALREAGFRTSGRDRFWLRTTEPIDGPEEGWLISMLDKDNAFRGLELVP